MTSKTSAPTPNVELTPGERTLRDLRTAIAAVEASLLDFEAAPEAVRDRTQKLGVLRVSWQSVVDLLAIEPEPERRACPFCGGAMRQIATRCVHCWKRSSPN